MTRVSAIARGFGRGLTSENIEGRLVGDGQLNSRNRDRVDDAGNRANLLQCALTNATR